VASGDVVSLLVFDTCRQRDALQFLSFPVVFGTDFADDAVFLVVAIGIQTPEFLLRTILRRLSGNY
jgi:hypothetical protein